MNWENEIIEDRISQLSAAGPQTNVSLDLASVLNRVEKSPSRRGHRRGGCGDWRSGFRRTHRQRSEPIAGAFWVPLWAIVRACPAGITVVRATSPQGRQSVSRPLSPFALPRAAPAAKRWGSLSPLPPPPGAAHRATRGHAGRRPATVVAADAGNPCQPASHKAFQARPRPQQRGLAL